MNDNPPTPVVAKPTWDFNDVVKAVVVVSALAAVIALAFIGDSQIRLQAATALITLLAGASGYLFRGRVANTDNSIPVVTNIATMR